MSTKIAYIGAGSLQFGPIIVQDILLSNEQIISGAFGARDFVARLGIFFKNSPAIVQKNNDALGQKISS